MDLKDKRETIAQRRERVLGQKSLRYAEVSTQKSKATSRTKRREQILQAQRVHRQRNLDYIKELENEIFRLRGLNTASVRASDDSPPALTVHGQTKEHDQIVAAKIDACQVTLQLLIQCLNRHLGPGLLMKQEIVDVYGVGSLPRNQELGFCAPPQVGLEIHDALTQMLLLNFSEAIAPTLLAFDDPKNGYNSLLLPLAHDDELVRTAMLAASATHLQFKRPQLAHIAMRYQTTAIQALSGLAGATLSSESNPEATLAAIVILIVNDMMQGGTSMPTLLGMARSWTEAMSGTAESRNMALRSFLQQQIQMFEHFAQPLLSERSFFTQQHDMYTVFSALESAVRQACALYTYHVAFQMPPDDIQTRMMELKNTTLLIPCHTPGESSLAWVYFIAAAESVSPLHRTFFTRKLMGIYERGTFSDITAAFNVLHRIWNCRSLGGNWTQTLMQMPLLFR